jgi:hypothetical protein
MRVGEMGSTARRVAWLLFVIQCAGLGGCSNKLAPTPDRSAASSGKAGSDSGVSDSSVAAAPVSEHGARDQRTKWIGNVPYDVFFDRPLQTYQQSSESTAPGVAVATTSSEGAGTAEQTPPATPSGGATPTDVAAQSTAPSGNVPAIDWGSVVPMAQLEAETKDIRTRLSANLQTVATFNANTDAIETDGSVLALIAAIIERHPDSVNWKDRAPFVRQLAYDIYSNASGKGRGPLQKTKEPFEKIVNIWDGGPAPEMEAAPLAPLGEVGDRAQVMLRFETGFNWLRSDVNTATRLKEEKDKVVRETAVLAALAAALGDPTFDSADQEAYRMLLQQFVDGQQAIQRAAESDDFPGFEQARDSVQKSCDACHLEYRNSNESDR